jgi:hemolysin activation/secretion protein
MSIMMNKMLFTTLALIAFNPFANAATQTQIDQALQTNAQVLQEQKAMLEEQQNKLAPIKAPTGLDLESKLTLPNSLVDANVECIPLYALKVEGATLLDEWEVEVLELPFVGKCINSDLVSGVLASASDFYIQRGFITTRAYLPNQNLKEGFLRIVIAEGMVEDVVVEGNSENINLVTTFPVDLKEPLHIRDIEQAVDQLNAMPGNDVTLQIVPGSLPQTSGVVFTNHGDGRPKGSITVNNGGSKATGENVLSVALSAGDLLNLGDVWSVSGTDTIEPKDGSASSRALSIAFPHGYNTYGISASNTKYQTTLTFPTTGTVLSSNGATQGVSLSAQRLVFRDQGTKHTVGTTLSSNATQSYIAGELIGVSSRTTNALKFHSQSLMGFGNKMLIVSPEVEVGLSEVDNLPAGTNTPVENPQTEYVRYKLRVDWSQPFALAGLPVEWKSAFNYQYSPNSLYGSQQISIGGLGSVRGFKGVSLAGDRGYYFQNSLVFSQSLTLGGLSGDMKHTVGYDLGEVSSGLSGAYIGGLQGMFLGTNLKMDNWSLGLSWSNPIGVTGNRDKGDSSVLATLSLDI